ncbi:methyltransferase family protein [Prosthecomicrobium sp. N25]|uniref:methyltransferase family protein n=1 Tax=Prosthecomicrobium sp. N25 TaxID=3129254 RepID=UPI003077CD2B
MTDPAERPNTIPWPPLILVAAALLAFGLGRLAPLPLPGGPIRVGAGAIACLAALGLDLVAMTAMRRARTNILPTRPALTLLTDGAFALSRNPIYLGNALLLAGLGLVFGEGWFLVAALAASLLVDRLAIRREEAHLAARFGEAWRAYAATTPRWIGPIGRRPAGRDGERPVNAGR